MILLEDTRNQIAKHDIKHAYFESIGVEIRRTKLYVGDYTLPTNQSICVDTKEHIQEICSNVCGKEHARFIREIERAAESNIKLIVLVENEDGVKDLDGLSKWQNPRLIRWCKLKALHEKGKALRLKIPAKPPVKGESLAKALKTIEEKHPNVKFMFCTPLEAGQKVIDILEGGAQAWNS